MTKAADFEKLDLFRFLNKREHPPEKIFRVADASAGWLNCRMPNLHGGAEHRFSFSDEYLAGAEIEKLGKGVEPVKPRVYTKPKKKKLYARRK